MNSPAMTWRVRRIGHTLWSSVRTRSRIPWSWIERVQRTAQPGKSGDDERRAAASLRDEEHVASDAYDWLTALRLDRAATAVHESG